MISARHELVEQVHGDGEHDGAVLLRGDDVECVQVPQLHRRLVPAQHLRRVPQRPARLVLALRRDNLTTSAVADNLYKYIFTFVHLCLSLARGLCLGGHGALQILGQPHVLDLDPLHLHTPGLRGLVQRGLHADKLITTILVSIVRCPY